MRIRLHGTPEENGAALAALAAVLEIHTVSRPYPDRPPSQLQRVYIDANHSPAHHPIGRALFVEGP